MAEPEKPPPRPPQKVGVRAFRANFAGFMRQVRHGAAFAVTARDEVIAIVQPPQPAPPPPARPLAGPDHDGAGLR